jgi:hypothetical protein
MDEETIADVPLETMEKSQDPIQRAEEIRTS